MIDGLRIAGSLLSTLFFILIAVFFRKLWKSSAYHLILMGITALVAIVDWFIIALQDTEAPSFKISGVAYAILAFANLIIAILISVRQYTECKKKRDI